MHSKSKGLLTKGRMRYGRAWAIGSRAEAALVVEDPNPSPLDGRAHGTFVKVQFSDNTRPKNLTRLASTFEGWSTILRTRTAAGQILLKRTTVAPIDLRLTVIGSGKTVSAKVEPSFLFPDTVKRAPQFRFLDLNDYFKTHAEQSSPPPEKIRQDGLYLVWDSSRIKDEFSDDLKREFADELKVYVPVLLRFRSLPRKCLGRLKPDLPQK